jgi:hypothetical protein
MVDLSQAEVIPLKQKGKVKPIYKKVYNEDDFFPKPKGIFENIFGSLKKMGKKSRKILPRSDDEADVLELLDMPDKILR